ncbi:unnamed protein product, partial [Allacma fusca]
FCGIVKLEVPNQQPGYLKLENNLKPGYWVFASKWNWIPFTVIANPEQRVYIKPANKFRRCLWSLFYFYKVFRVALSAFLIISASGLHLPVYDVALHTLYTLPMTVGVLMETFTMIRNRAITITVFNFLFDAEETILGTRVGARKNSNQKPYWKKYSKSEMVVTFLPHASIILIFIYIALTACFCSRLHLYHVVPEQWRNPFTFCILYIQENIVFQSIGLSCVVAMGNEFLFMEKVTDILNWEILFLR